MNSDLLSEQKSDSHPIPLEGLENIDVIIVGKDGLVTLKIIVAGYLDNSKYTEKRVLDKINNYLTFINYESFAHEFGVPSDKKTHIILNCNKRPHNAIVQLIKSIEAQVKLYNASISIECV